MSSPLVWVVFPILAAILLYSLRRWKRVIYIAGVLFSLLLALLAWQLPVGDAISLGFPGLPPLKIADTLTAFGRPFILDRSIQPLLALIYLGVSLWFTGAYVAGVDRLFIPLGLGMAALIAASLSAGPSLYAVLVILIAALISVPILSPPGRPVQNGVLRFITFQTLGMCIILFADWLLSVVRVSPDQASLALPTTILMGLGFALVTAILPFHTWVPMLAEEAHPYAAAFIFFMLPASVALLGLDYLESFRSLGTYDLLITAIRLIGALMVMVGGLWAAFERHLGRIFGFAVTVQIGMALLAISLGSQTGAGTPLLGLFFGQLLPQGAAIALWALALSALRSREPSLRFRKVQGLARSLPIAAAGIILSNFSLAGFPFLASFPGDVALWSALMLRSLPTAIFSLLGNAFLFAAGLRTLAVLVTGESQEDWRITEGGWQSFLLLAGLLALFVLGLAPQWFLPTMANLAQLFGSTAP